MCSMTLTDQETGSVSYVRCVEFGGSPVLPATFPMLVVGTMWEKIDNDMAETMSVRIVFATPTQGESTVFMTSDVEINRPLQKMNFHLPGVQTGEFGRHELRVEYKPIGEQWRTASILPLYIHHAPMPQNITMPVSPPANA
jgi:hypothetical protein